MNTDFMFYETFKEDIDNVRNLYGEEEAELYALDLVYYGVRGIRKTKKSDVSTLHNALLISAQRSIDKSREHKERAIEEANEQKRKLQNIGARKRNHINNGEIMQ